MASPSSSQTLGDRSHWKPIVTVYDWWLVKSKDYDGKNRLAVAGVCSPKGIPQEVFTSAPIRKRYDIFTLETTDGETVFLGGFFNKQKTIANGFSDEIAKRFQSGFYPGWEKGVAELLAGDSNPNTSVVSGRISDLDSEGEASGAAVQSGGKMSDVERCPSNFACWVTQFLLEYWSKLTNQLVGNSLTSKKKGVEGSNSSSLHLSLEEGSPEQVSCKEMHDTEFLEPLSSRLSLDNSIIDLVNHAVEEETGTEEFRSTGLQPCGIPKTLEENEKEPESGFSKVDDLMNYAADVELDTESIGLTEFQSFGRPETREENEKNSISEPATSALEILDKVLDANTPGVNKKRKASSFTLEARKKKKSTFSTVTTYTSIIPPESLSTGWSRTGRLRLPPLQFWRNQLPVYDKDHGVIGIEDEVARATPSRDTLPKPRKRKGNRG